MKEWKRIIVLMEIFVLLVSGIAFAQKDAEGSKDHSMFTRMDNFYIIHYEEEKFAAADFRDEKGKEIKVEGKYYKIDYHIKKGSYSSEWVAGFEEL